MELSAFAKGLKETAVGRFGQWLFEQLGIENQGIMDTFKVDKEARVFDITIKFKNQEEPTDFKIQYSLEEREGKEVLILTPAEGSQEWLNKAVDSETARRIFNRPIELPPLVGTVVKHFL